ncbi:hypothetical protein ACQY1Q_01305 [Tenacibaculum sp. TC6]|uniref:hypothetical protein n=1 Tax=Tenacibaculum sp. TC6 TaxID=3423223 RepID=UPI003D36DB3B
MEEILTFLSTYSSGILVLILTLFSLILMINWLAVIFNWGKYKSPPLYSKNSGNLAYMVTQFFANLINDFKHFLALIIVLIFAGLIVFSMATTDDFNNKMKALQLVIASLGGIVGTVIGYYFGESAAKSNSPITTAQTNEVQGLGIDGEIEPAPSIEINDNE